MHLYLNNAATSWPKAPGLGQEVAKATDEILQLLTLRSRRIVIRRRMCEIEWQLSAKGALDYRPAGAGEYYKSLFTRDDPALQSARTRWQVAAQRWRDCSATVRPIALCCSAKL